MVQESQSLNLFDTRIHLIVVIIEIELGATVPINFQGMLTCVHLLLSHGQLISIWHSQEMDVHFFTIAKLDLNSLLKDIMEDN